MNLTLLSPRVEGSDPKRVRCKNAKILRGLVMTNRAAWISVLVGLSILFGSVSNPALARKSARVHPKAAHARSAGYPQPPYPGHPPDCPQLPSYNPANPDRGYCDPGFAYHGNLNGCVVDLGYGRWEPCDIGGSR
jgi:hypothetical protein